MKHAIPAGRMDPPGTAAASGRFKRFDPENEQQIRVPDIAADPKLGLILRAWDKFEMAECHFMHVSDRCDKTHSGDWYEKEYRKALGLIEGMDLQGRDIWKFSLALHAFQHEPGFCFKAGIFLSALMSSCKEAEFVISTTHLSVRLNALGYRNAKIIAVNGDIGHIAGLYMEGGSLIIDGGAAEQLGYGMGGGTVIVGKNAEDSAGTRMTGGLIHVKGDAGLRIGCEMEDGEIVVDGNTDSFLGDRMRGGRIIVRGDAGSDIGVHMSGGEIHLFGGGFSGSCLSRRFTGGSVVHNGERIYRIRGEDEGLDQ